MYSADDDWEKLKDTQHEPIPKPQEERERPSIKKGRFYFAAVVVALLFLSIKQWGIDDPPSSFKEFVQCSPDLLILLPFFPAGLAPLFVPFLPNNFELGAFLPISWIVYIVHGIATACAQNRKTICTLLTILVILLLVNIYGCSVMLKGL